VDRNRIKQRIVGGVVLIALGAIVIPFVLDMHHEREWWGTGNIPKKPDSGFVTRVLPLEDWSKQAQSELKDGAAQLNANAPEAKGEGPAPSPASTPPPIPDTTPPPSAAPSHPAVTPPAAAAALGAEGWVVQVASFSNGKNAEELREKLRKEGYRAFVDHIKQGSQTIYRVRIGPDPQRAAAETIRDHVARTFKIKGMVLHIP